jgi:hypothetical protein
MRSLCRDLPPPCLTSREIGLSIQRSGLVCSQRSEEANEGQAVLGEPLDAACQWSRRLQALAFSEGR